MNEYFNPSHMFALAQITGSFLAIVAGFYTTKMFSLSNEKRKLKNQKQLNDNELQTIKYKVKLCINNVKIYKVDTGTMSIDDMDDHALNIHVNKTIEKLNEIKPKIFKQTIYPNLENDVESDRLLGKKLINLRMEWNHYKRIKSEYETELNSIKLAKWSKAGMIAIFATMSLGIIVPTTHIIWAKYVNENAFPLALISFILGIIVITTYIIAEVYESTRV